MMTPQEMEKRIVRYGDLIPCKTAFIDAHTQVRIKRKTSPLSVGGSRKVRINMFISIFRTVLILALPGSRPNAETHCIRTAQPKCFSCFRAGGGFFGGVGAPRVRWFLRQEISSTCRQVFSEGLKISEPIME